VSSAGPTKATGFLVGERLEMHVTIPPDTVGRVVVPAIDSEEDRWVDGGR
jgi:hypothetical protein